MPGSDQTSPILRARRRAALAAGLCLAAAPAASGGPVALDCPERDDARIAPLCAALAGRAAERSGPGPTLAMALHVAGLRADRVAVRLEWRRGGAAPHAGPVIAAMASDAPLDPGALAALARDLLETGPFAAD